jgi:hypothetical protein
MDCRKHIHIDKLPKERMQKHPIWKKIESLGFASHGSNGRRVTNWCNPFTGPPFSIYLI